MHLTRNAVHWTHIVLMVLGILVIPPAQAAGFNCAKASKPVEKVICADPSLSEADGLLNDAYTYLLAQCADIAARADLRATQRRWVAGVGKDYGEGSPEALDRLEAAYRARNEVLAKLLAECSPHQGPVQATIRNVNVPGTEDTLLFVESDPPQPGWRINKLLFRRYGATPPLKFSELNAFFARHKPVDNNGGYANYSSVFNQGNLLVLHVSGSDCEPEMPRCSPYDSQLVFDIRAGRTVALQELYTEQGANALSQKLKEKLFSLATSRLAALSKADAGKYGEQYKQCMTNWATGMEVGVEANFTPDGRMQFGLGNCSHYDEYGPDPVEPEGTALDKLVLTAALPEVRPYLNAYGKSLLLGEGDVRAPVHEPPLVCKKSSGLPVRSNDRPSAQGIQASAGSNHYLLLTRDGKLWGWGEGNSGELGVALAFNPVPLLQGDDYAQAAGGQFYTAALRRDGTLWTWGSNYMHRLGRSTDKSGARPVRIGEGYISLKVESSEGMALKRDGTVWGWGGKMETPQQLMGEVVQIEYGPKAERLMLKKDGSLWALGGWSGNGKPDDETHPRLIGSGFSRLAAHNGDLAYKADGSLWAWGEMRSISFRLGDQERSAQPANIGSGFVKVKVGGVYSLYLVALKADSSLWLAKTRGAVTRLVPVGCGYADVVAGGEYLLALKEDGSLEVWAPWKTKEAAAQQEHRTQMSPWGLVSPVLLGKGYTELFQMGDLFGDMGAKAVVLKKDGTVSLFKPPWAPATGGPKDWFEQVPFPKEANLSR